jgi:ferredoxin
MAKMAKDRPIYARRRFLRSLEGLWTHLERAVNRLATAAALHLYNPLYYTGMLAIFLLLVLTVTGLYVTVLYRPGSERAYGSIAAISATWYGSIIRTVHRYAADALILVTFIHALKTLLSDRFWGSRWFAWVSGWFLLAIFWIVGTMGYFLVWDRPAQWLTEYAINLLKGAFALSFLGPESAARTYSFFVIVLFLHIFIPLLLIVGVLVHVLRLARARYWTPRWLAVQSVLVLVLLAIWRPAASGAPADLGRVVDLMRVDWWYMSFLALSSHLGAPLFWTLAFVALGAAMALPWLWRGQHEGPAYVIAPQCTGCALCARECPYEAIEMTPRDDDTPYNTLAVVKPHLCTGCGVCVGACADSAIELERLPSAVVRQDLKRTLAQASKRSEPPVVVYTCDRHASLGTLPALLEATPDEELGLGPGGALPLMQAKMPGRVNTGAWADSQGRRHPVMTCVAPCMGMLHPQWAAETVEAGAGGAIMVTCPANDCAFREGPNWVDERMKRRRTLRKGNTFFLQLAPGSQREVLTTWAGIVGDEKGKAKGSPAVVVGQEDSHKARLPSLPLRLRHMAAGSALLLVTFWLSILLDLPASARLPAQAQLRLVINHGGKLVAASGQLSADVLAKLPKNIDPAMVLGGERFPVQLRLMVDGQQVLERSYKAGGLRREGSIYGMESWWLPSGAHQVEIALMDDGANWQTVYTGALEVAPGEAKVFYFDSEKYAFVERKF